MHAGADRIGLLGKKIAIRLRECIREWFEIFGPTPAVRVVPTVQFFREFQSPGPAVSALERLAIRLLQVSDFSLNVLSGEVYVEGVSYLCCLGKIGKTFQQ